MPLTKSKIKELNADITMHEIMFKRGDISYEELMEHRSRLIGEYYMRYYDEDMQLHGYLDGYHHDEPQGILGIILQALKKIF
tara:strand:+ start:962 stop:1207 length:246 start_codon:yes stop_codon:yes gene_type:complete